MRRLLELRSPRLVLLAGAVAATLLVPLALERPATACGGLFCDGPPPNPFAPLPVAQNGENVVFAITKDPAGGAPTIEAHIQILYTGDAAKFSWVVPVEGMPVLSTGTDKLFTTLATLTQPRFQAQYQTSGDCIPEPSYPTFNGTAQGGAATGSAGSSGGVVGLPPAVTVSFQGAVGPFDAAVIKSDDPVALKMWLSDNGYIVTDAAGALIDTYVRESKFFVALKLLNGLGVQSIQPIVLTFRGTEACVPLRLTAIAANPDMPVLVWVLSDKRAVPRGFYEMTIDEARIDWQNGGTNYSSLVGLAADEAGGNAFVAEYAGTSAIARDSVYPITTNNPINLDALRAAQTPPTYVQQLAQMGLANDPLMLGLLDKYIPMPDAVKAMGVTDAQFYGNLAMYWAMYAFPAFDLAGLTDAISTSIVMPRQAAQTMIDAHPYLTRLNTFLSPAEMTQDAFFFESQDLPDVSNVHTATITTVCENMRYLACNAPQRLDLADGSRIWLRGGNQSSTCQYGGTSGANPLDSLPAAQMAWQRSSAGVGMPVLDNTAKIRAGIDANNKALSDDGCGCNLGNGGAGGLATLALFSGLGLTISRRRRARRRE